ncbi:MAG TPA: TonB-dependent receptor [Acidobacteriaceae bacterium]|nr:TonB-dependent receptor [Acidobacteriaceae bacterium]
MMSKTLRRPASGWGIFAKLWMIAVVMAALVWSAPMQAQQITGTIAGTVKDTQGALVPGASIKATNVDTGFARSAVADGLGAYSIQYLPVGRYMIEVEAAGFKKFRQENLVLTVDQTQTLAITLDVGAQSETVMVTEAPPQVNTNTAELGRTIQPEEIVGLPLVNRNAYAELSLTPGVQSNSASAQGNPSGTPNFQVGVPSTQVVVNGGTDGGVPMVAFYLDGGINMTGIRNYGNQLPNPDALQEFRVETNNFSAQYGRMSGAVVTAVTKSGTNQFHGSLFEFNRNTDLNATPWNSLFNAPYHRNQFGGVIGGPVKHDQAFFLFSYAGLRQVIGSQLSGAIVPTAAERSGDFTDAGFNVYVPGTYSQITHTGTQVVGTNSSPNCATPTPNCVPSDLLDSTVANLMSKYIPLPNEGNNNYTGFFTGPTSQNEYLGKYDQQFGEKDHAAVSYFYLHTTQNAAGGGNIPYTINQSFSTQQVMNISDIHTISPTTANQAWGTFTRVAGGRVNLPAIGLDDLGSTFTTQGVKTLPQVNISGFFSAGGSLAGPVSDTDFYSVRDMVTMVKGKHSLAFGGEVSLEKDMVVGNLVNFGSFSFSSSAPTTTGNALSDFITGQVSTMEQDTPYHGLISNWYVATYLQDTYRILPRLTLNLGLRYDIQTSPVESSDLTATFIPGRQSTKVPAAPLGMLFPGDSGVPRGIAPNQYYHVSPRVGVAWDPFGNGKTAVRAGAGVFYGSVSGNEWNQPANAQPFAIRQTFNSIASFTNVYGNASSFPNGDPFPYTYSPSNPRFLPAASIETLSTDYKWPLVYQFNAAIQRQLPRNTSLTVAYVSTLSHHLPFMTDLNYAPYAPGASTSQASINARRPYDPGVLGQVTYGESNETASYHSLQISAARPLTHHLMLAGFYVLSHSFESVNVSAVGQAGAQDFANLWEERGPTDNDRRHVASISGMWNIDYYHGSNFFMKQIVNGWTVSPIVSLQSGQPFSISTGSNKNFDSSNANRPNLVPGVNAFLDPHRCRLCAGGAAAAWFNTAAFTPNGPGLGIGPGGADGNTPRDYLRAPGYRDIDLGLFRDFKFERGFVFQLRGEATNAFNMVSLNAPTANLASGNNGKITGAASPRLIQVGARLTF